MRKSGSNSKKRKKAQFQFEVRSKAFYVPTFTTGPDCLVTVYNTMTLPLSISKPSSSPRLSTSLPSSPPAHLPDGNHERSTTEHSCVCHTHPSTLSLPAYILSHSHSEWARNVELAKRLVHMYQACPHTEHPTNLSEHDLLGYAWVFLKSDIQRWKDRMKWVGRCQETGQDYLCMTYKHVDRGRFTDLIPLSSTRADANGNSRGRCDQKIVHNSYASKQRRCPIWRCCVLARERIR
jgi:hypothetical protein